MAATVLSLLAEVAWNNAQFVALSEPSSDWFFNCIMTTFQLHLMCDLRRYEKLKTNGESVRIWQDAGRGWLASRYRLLFQYWFGEVEESRDNSKARTSAPPQSLPLLQSPYKRNVLKVSGYCTWQIKFSSEFSFIKPTQAHLMYITIHKYILCT